MGEFFCLILAVCFGFAVANSAAPGFVDSNWGADMPFYLKGPIRGLQVRLAKPFVSSCPLTCSIRISHFLNLAGPAATGCGWQIHLHLRRVYGSTSSASPVRSVSTHTYCLISFLLTLNL